MIKNFAELQERVRSSEPLVVSVAQAADQEVLLSVKAAADQGFIKPVLTGDRERIEELCGRIGLSLWKSFRPARRRRQWSGRSGPCTTAAPRY